MTIDKSTQKCTDDHHQVFDVVTSPELAEALAVRRALTLAQEEGFNKIILASDCLTVIKRMLSNTLDRTGIGVVIQDINQADRGGFLVCEV
jgi:ribonuclease HI